jgi:adenylate cyclase
VGNLAGRAEYLLSEMRRRRVFRVLAGYIALSFALLQLADLVYPVIGAPEWAFSATVALTVLGFVPAVALAWIYDITSDGVRRTPAAEQLSTAAAARPSLAVLPFRNLTSDAENEYFSDGVTEDIIARVSGIGALRVISRTSVMQYKGETADVPAIAHALRVTHILEGSVRRAGGRVRIVAQLIDARSDEHCWVETYDRDLKDIFAIQSDVANRIAQALEARLTPGAQARPRSLFTETSAPGRSLCGASLSGRLQRTGHLDAIWVARSKVRPAECRRQPSRDGVRIGGCAVAGPAAIARWGV